MSSDAAARLRETTEGDDEREAQFRVAARALRSDDPGTARDAIKLVMARHPIDPRWDKFRQMTALMNRANATLEEDPSYNLAAADIPLAFAGLAGRWDRYWHLLQTEAPATGNLMAASAVIQWTQGSATKALVLAREAAAREDADAPSMNAVANILLESAQPEEALEAYRKANALEPGNPAILSNMARSLESLDQMDEALEIHRRAVSLMPQHPEIAFNHGNLLTRLWLLDDAEVELRRVLAIKPDHYPAMLALANNLQAMRRCGEAADLYARALRALPGERQVWSNHLMNLPYLPAMTNERLAEEHRKAAEVIEAGVERIALRERPKDRRKTRVGYFAAYYRNHPAGYLSEAAIAAHDHDAFEIFFYIANRSADGALDRLKPGLTAIRDISGMDDDYAASVIAGDELDILVDLSGHTRDNRLGVLARKPAPVIASWGVSYWNSTGLTAVDYLIADDRLLPEGGEAGLQETVTRLPEISIAYRPPESSPDVTPLPMLKQGYPTFGCFNRLAKVNNEVIYAWTDILNRVPDARLRLQCRALDSAGVRDDILRRFADGGVEAGRIDLIGRRSQHDLMSDYGEIDLVLDPFPWNGSIITCEAMWMGVPTVTLRGDSIIARYSDAYQAAVGLDGFTADTVEDYVSLATAWAAKSEELAAIRNVLRAQMAASPLCDGLRMARNLEDAYRRMLSA